MLRLAIARKIKILINKTDLREFLGQGIQGEPEQYTKTARNTKPKSVSKHVVNISFTAVN